MTIAILCPSRGRPEQFMRMAQSAFATAFNRNEVKIYLYTNEEDCANYKNLPDGTIHFTGLDLPCVAAINHMASHESMRNNDLLMVAGDDTVFTTPGWDKGLTNAYEALTNKIHVYSLRDSRSDEGTPHPIITKEFMQAMGYAFPPIFLHWFSDTWVVEMAKANNCFTHLKDYMLVHDKPSDRGTPDETHNRLRRMGWHLRDAEVSAKCQRFLEAEKEHLRKAMQSVQPYAAMGISV